jgi:SNF2 family DNA or RNA helicase
MVRLMGHQVEGIEFLTTRRAGLLAFEQGLGKTLVAIEAFTRLQAEGLVDLMLVLCPNSLKRTWANELEQFAPQLKAVIVIGGRQARREQLAQTDATVVLINYETARNEITAIRALLQRRRAALVLDESHYIKNHRSLNCTAAEHFAPLATYRWLLTGTPVTNSPVDIYPQLCVVAAGQPLGSYAAFEAKYARREPTTDELRALSVRVQPYLLRRTKRECLDLPEKTFLDVYVPLPPWQRKLYNAMRDELAHEVEQMSAEEFHRFIPTAMVKLLRLSQVASNPALLIPDEMRVPAKFTELDRILDDLVAGNDEKVILWCYYVNTIKALEARFARYGVASIYGETDVDDRQRLASRFQTDPSLKILIANPAAAATGFTLTAASYTIYESLSWRYDLYAQSQDRNHRIGQRNPVTYIRLLAEDTIEDAIVDALARKTRVAGEIIGDNVAPPVIAAMTPRAFLDMLASGRLAEASEA